MISERLSRGPKFGEMKTWAATGRPSGRSASQVASVAPVETLITSTLSPSKRPMAAASVVSASQSCTRASPMASGAARPWPVSRLWNRLAPSACATCSASGAVSSRLAEKPCR